MKNTKLIPKHQIGKKILKFFADIGNALIAGDSGAGAAAAAASGYKYNRKTRKWELSEENLKEAKELRNNLEVISTFSPIHPATALIENAVIPGVVYIGGKMLKPVSKIISKKMKKPKLSIKAKYFKDEFGREITPTPYPGLDSDLVNAVDEAQLSVLRDYYSPEKINQIKKTMAWGNLEISELQDEIIRTIGTKTDVQIKGPNDGFTIIGLHVGKVRGTGTNAEAIHTVTLNRERMPNLQTAQEAGIHEIGVHGKTVSMLAENFGKGGYSDKMKDTFPRIAELTLKNKDLAENTLVLNKRGQFLDQFKNIGDLEKYFVEKGLSWKDKWDKFYNNYKYYKYTTQADEKTARAYTGLLFNKVYDPNIKTLNIKQLERFYTPESVDAFKKSVLGISPVLLPTGNIIGTSTINNND